MSDRLSLKVNINNEIEGFDLKVGNTEYQIYPNTSLLNSYTFSYRFLTFTVTLNPDFLNTNRDDEVRGKTNSVKYATELRFSRLIQSLGYYSTEGFYLRNTSDFDPGWTKGDPYFQFPDLIYKEFGGRTIFKINPNLSIAALSAPNTRQLKSTGSLIPTLSYRYYLIDDRSEIQPGGATQKSSNFELSFAPGYIHTFVLKQRFYFSLGVNPGIGRISTKLVTRTRDEEFESNSRTWLYSMSMLSGIGYDTGKFYCGSRLTGNVYHHSQPSGNASINQNEVIFEIFAGYRFNAPKFLKRSFDTVQNIIPIL